MAINVTRSSMPPFEEYCEEIRELWHSHWLTNMGAKHQQLEADLKAYLGCEELVLFTNGHLALENVIEAFNLHLPSHQRPMLLCAAAVHRSSVILTP